MYKEEIKVLSRKLLAIMLAVAMVFTIVSAPAYAEEEPPAQPKVTEVEYMDGQEGYTFYSGFNDHYYVASGSRIVFTYDDGTQRTLFVRSGAYIRDDNSSKIMDLYNGRDYSKVVLRDNGGDVYVDYYNQFESDTSDFTGQLYTKNLRDLTDLEKLSKGTKSINSDSMLTKYYYVDSETLLPAGDEEGILNTYTVGDTDTYLTLYDMTGHRIRYDNNGGENNNASLYYKVTKGQTYILALKSNGNRAKLVTELATEEGHVPSVAKVEYQDGEEGYTFYNGFNDHYYVASGSQIVFTYDNGDKHTLYVRSGAYIKDGNSSKTMSLYTGRGKTKVVLRNEGQDVFVDYYDEFDTDKLQYSNKLYTKNLQDLSAMKKLQKVTETIRSDSRNTKYYLVDPASLLPETAEVGVLHSFTKYVDDLRKNTYLTLYDANGQVIDSDNNSGEGSNADLYYQIKKGETYILALNTYGNYSDLATELTTEDGPVASISYECAKEINVFEGVNGYYETDDNGEEIFYYDDENYYQDLFIEGSKLTVTDKDGLSTEYISQFDDDDLEYYFVNQEGEKLNTWSDVTYIDDQYTKHWTKGSDNYVTIAYKGAKCKLPITVVENPVASIQMDYDEEITLIENLGGRYKTDKNGEKYYYYNGAYPFIEGSKLTVTNKDGSLTEYNYYYDEDNWESGYISDSGEKISSRDYRYYPTYNEDQKTHHWTLGRENYITVTYMGAECQVAINIVENPVMSIRFEYAEDVILRENIDGYYYWGHDGERFFEYNIPSVFNEGNKLIVTDKNGVSNEYICVYDEETSRYVFANSLGEQISDNEISWKDDQWSNHWTPGVDNYFTITYMGKKCKVPVTIEENPVASIRFDCSEDITIIEGSNGAYYTDYNGEEYFYYNLPNLFIPGSKITVTNKEGVSTEYIYKYDEGNYEYNFVNDAGERIPVSDLSFQDNQWSNHWIIGGENYITVIYQGARYDVPVTIIEGSTASISFDCGKEISYTEGVNGYANQDSYGETYFQYYDPDIFVEGSKLTVTDKEGVSTEYKYYLDKDIWQAFYVSDSGERIPVSDLSYQHDQWNNHWTIGGENYITIIYQGARDYVPVTIEYNPVASIRFEPADNINLIEGIDGYSTTGYDGEEFFYYNSPYLFVEGSKLIVTKKEGVTTEYTCIYDNDASEYYYVSDTGERIPRSDLSSYADQWEQHWTKDGENYITITYMGADYQIPVTIVDAAIESISYEPAQPITFKEGINIWTSEDGDYRHIDDYVYSPSDGDVFITNDTKGNTRTYIYNSKSLAFINNADPSDSISRSAIEFRPADTDWTYGSDNDFIITYKECSQTIKATLEEGPNEEDLVAAQNVVQLIETANETFTSSGEAQAAVDAAQAAYDALTEEQKELLAVIMPDAAAKLEEAQEKANQQAEKERADQAAAQNAANLIQVADGAFATAAEAQEAVNAAKAAMDALTSDQKALLADIMPNAAAKLEEAQEKANQQAEKERADQAAAQNAADLIQAANGTFTSSGEAQAAVNEARTAYDALTEEQKGLLAIIMPDAATKLEEAQEKATQQAEKERADQAAAQNAADLIRAAGETFATAGEAQAAVDAAQAAYNALTEEQKEALAEIMPDAATKLEEAQAKAIQQAEEEAQAAADQAAAQNVADLITAAGETFATADQAQAAVNEARTAYDALTEEQKELLEVIMPDATTKLEEAQAKATQQAAAQNVADLIAAAGGTFATAAEAQAAVDEAKAAMDMLTVAQQAALAEIMPDAATRLEEAQAKVIQQAAEEDQVAAQNVADLINTAGGNFATAAQAQAAVVAAKTAMDALTATQKAALADIMPDAATKLEEAQAKATQQATEETEKENKAKAQEVAMLIEMANKAYSTSAQAQAAVSAAQAALSKLTPAQKAILQEIMPDAEAKVSKAQAAATQLAENEKKAAAAKSRVVSIPATNITVASKKLFLKKGAAYSLTYILTPLNTTDKVSFTTSNKKIATVSATGKIKAKAKGTAKITLTTTSGRSVVIKVNVATKATKTTKVSVAKKLNMKAGEVKFIAYKRKPVKATDKVTFKSSVKSVVSVDSNGKLIAVKAGKAKITIKSGKKKAICTVTVK